MAIVQAKCINCGSVIKIADDYKNGICEHCGSAFITEDVINNYTTSYTYNTTQHITKHVYGDDNPDSGELIAKGEVLLKLRDFEKAKKAFETAIDDNPADWRGWFGMVKCCTQNLTDLIDTTHFDYFEKAKTVADKPQTEKLFEAYRPYLEKKQAIADAQAKTKQAAEQKKQDDTKRAEDDAKQKNKKTMKIVIIAIAAFLSIAILCVILTTTGVIKPSTDETPGNATTIKTDAFDYTVNADGTLTVAKYKKHDQSVIIPETVQDKKVTAIADEVFTFKISLKDITVPSSVTSIGGKAFSSTSIENIYFLSPTPPTLGDKVFYKDNITSFDHIIKFYVPDASLTAYRTAWNAYRANIRSDSKNDSQNTLFWLTYDYNHGFSTKHIIYDTTDTAFVLETPSRTGYIFDGWFTDKALTSPSVLPNVSKTDATLYAKWTGNPITITYDGNGATYGKMDPKQTTTGARIKLDTPLFLKDGYTFKGWSETKSGGTIILTTSTYTVSAAPSGTLILYAIWEKRPTT